MGAADNFPRQLCEFWTSPQSNNPLFIPSYPPAQEGFDFDTRKQRCAYCDVPSLFSLIAKKELRQTWERSIRFPNCWGKVL
ncbi:hypothetical protein TNCV_3766591 [Trichonephila clavipes]|nr:hypothetical protein TNCV_3766591 [Trichonephila clavipes]